MKTEITIRDWHNSPAIEQVVTAEGKCTGFSYDGGRLDFDGYQETVWVMSHQFSVEFKEID